MPSPEVISRRNINSLKIAVRHDSGMKREKSEMRKTWPRMRLAANREKIRASLLLKRLFGGLILNLK